MTRSPSALTRAAGIVAFATAALAHADEGGVSFWLPGQFASFAAAPAAPGWSLGAIYFHSSVDASRSKSFPLGGQVVGGIDARADLVFLAPTYTFAEKVAGAQAALALVGAYGRSRVSADVAATDALGASVSTSESDTTRGGADLYPLGTLKWSFGVHNAMAYVMADVPVGSYRAGRLANIGIGHAAIDAGGGYTYLNKDARTEFSIVGGATYNFENDDTDYKNGIDGHVDWAASYFVAEGTTVGAVGYFYHQLTGDSGAGAKLGDFKSRVNGAGPQVGQFFPFNGGVGFVGLKSYWEWNAKNRPDGWNLWLSVSLPLSPPPK